MGEYKHLYEINKPPCRKRQGGLPRESWPQGSSTSSDLILFLFSFTVAMALHAVLVIVDALLTMLVSNSGLRVFMAVITGIFFVIFLLGMACFATRSVITVKSEKAVMVKCCRYPA